MNDTRTQLHFLIARLERLSADSIWAHRASGVRRSLVRALENLQAGRPYPPEQLQPLLDEGYRLLAEAAREIPDHDTQE